MLLAKATHAVCGAPEIRLLPATDRLTPLHVDVLHPERLVRPTYARSLLSRPTPKGLATAVFVFAASLGDVHHHFLFVSEAEASLFPLVRETGSNLSKLGGVRTRSEGT